MDFSMDCENTAMGSLFQQILTDMRNTSPLWEDFVAKASRLHTCLRAVIQATSSYLEAFQKIADAATKSRGASKDIGTALTRICLRHKAVETRMKSFTSAIMDSLIIPLQGKLEDWKRQIAVLDKEYTKEYKKRRVELKKISSDTLRLQKKGRKDQSNSVHNLVSSHLHGISVKHAEIEDVERKSLTAAIVEERLRYCTFVDMLQPVVNEECEVLSELGHVQEAMQSIANVAKDSNVLPSSMEQLISQFKSSLSLDSDFKITDCTHLALGSRKSSVCSIHSANSSESNESSSVTLYNKQKLQLAAPANMLIPGGSSDSGFCSSPILSKQLSENAQGTTTWPPLSQDEGLITERPHTISTAYERGHQRPQLTVHTFEKPENIAESRKLVFASSCKPLLPIRCSSLERPQGTSVNRSLCSNIMNRQSPSPIPAYITKDFSKPHQPMYVNTAELNAIGACIYSSQQSQQHVSNNQYQSIAPSQMSSNYLTTFSAKSPATVDTEIISLSIDLSPVISSGSQNEVVYQEYHSTHSVPASEIDNVTTTSSKERTISETDIVTKETTSPEGEDMSRASVQEKASMFEKLDQKQLFHNSNLSICANRSSSIANLEMAFPHRREDSNSNPFPCEKNSDKVYEDSVRELNNLIGKLDLFQLECDLRVDPSLAKNNQQISEILSEDNQEAEFTNSEEIKRLKCQNVNVTEPNENLRISSLHNDYDPNDQNTQRKEVCENDSIGNSVVVVLRCKEISQRDKTSPNVCNSKQRLSSFKANFSSKTDSKTLTDKEANLCYGAEYSFRTTRRTSSSSVKPPPPVRRSSSVTPQTNYSTSNSSNVQQTTLNLSAENLPPPPPFLLDRIGNDSVSVNVSEAIKALTVINHTPASPNTLRRAQNQPNQHIPLQGYRQTNIPLSKHSHAKQNRMMSSFRAATSANTTGLSNTTCGILTKSKADFMQTLNEKLAKQTLTSRAFAVRNLINNQSLPDPRVCHDSLMDQIRRGATLKRNRTINDRSAPIIN